VKQRYRLLRREKFKPPPPPPKRIVPPSIVLMKLHPTNRKGRENTKDELRRQLVEAFLNTEIRSWPAPVVETEAGFLFVKTTLQESHPTRRS
jgi:hypothetical protein